VLRVSGVSDLTDLCHRITFFIVVSFLNFCVLMAMLGFEFKRLGCHFSTFTDKKIIIFIILAVM